MAVHVGKVLRELYLGTGLKMERFAGGVHYDEKTIYYHFGKEHLNTAILEKYETGLKSLGWDIDVFDVISRKRKGAGTYDKEAPVSMTAERLVREPSVADLLRKAADTLDRERAAPAPDRDKAGT